MEFQRVANKEISWLYSDEGLDKKSQQNLASSHKVQTHHTHNTEKGKTPKPTTAITDEYTYFVFHIPYINESTKKAGISELNIYLFKNKLITIQSKGHLPTLENFFNKQKRELAQTSAATLFGDLMTFILSDLEITIDEQGDRIDILSKNIFQTKKQGNFIESSSLMRYNHILFYSALERQSHVLETLSPKNPLSRFDDKTNDYWHFIVERFQTLTFELTTDIQHLEGLVKTFETLVTHRTNQTVKMLTIISVTLLPLSLISGIFGMNFVYTPLLKDPLGFWITMVVMVIILIIFILAFKKKDLMD